MSESDLSMTYDEIRQRIGDHRGYGTDPAVWSDASKTLVELIIKSGCRKFYLQAPHKWSFLSPIHTLAVPSGSSEIDLPADFGFIVGDKVYFGSDSNAYYAIAIRSIGGIEFLKGMQTTTGRPTRIAVVSDASPGVTFGQRSKLLIWPTTDAAYTFEFRYSILPDALGPSAPRSYGGAAHAQTILEACLAASEQQDGMAGIFTQLYQQSLQASIEYDLKVKPQSLGRERLGARLAANPLQDYTVTYTP